MIKRLLWGFLLLPVLFVTGAGQAAAVTIRSDDSPLIGSEATISSGGGAVAKRSLATAANGGILVANRPTFTPPPCTGGSAAAHRLRRRYRRVQAVGHHNGIDKAVSTSAASIPDFTIIPCLVSIDIKPDEFPNIISPREGGATPVAILSTSSPHFDAPSQVNRTSLTFGRTGNEASLAYCTKVKDVNHDGLPDLLCRFTTRLNGFLVGDTVGILKGLTVGGLPFIGQDSVRIKQS